MINIPRPNKNIINEYLIKWDNLDMDIVNKIDNKTFQNLKQL